MSRTTTIAALAALALAATTSACAGSPSVAPSPTGSATPSASTDPTSSPSEVSSDASESVAPTPTTSPYPVASMTASAPAAIGTLGFTNTVTPYRDIKARHTLSIGQVRSTGTGTRLTFWINAPVEHSLVEAVGGPETYPTLTDPATKRVYQVDTWTDVNDNGLQQVECICSTRDYVTASTIHPMDAEYPPLPDSVQQVQVTIPGAKGSVTVPVTHG